MTVAFTNILNVLPSKELYTWEKFMRGGGVAQCEEKKRKKYTFPLSNSMSSWATNPHFALLLKITKDSL